MALSKAAIERRITDLHRELERIEQYGEDTHAVGTVLRFRLQFDPDGPTYHYAAVKTPVDWFVTGRNTVGMEWSDLVTLWREANTVTVEKASRFKDIAS